MTVQVYRPTPILIPDSVPVQREPQGRTQLSKSQLHSKAKAGEFDSRTILYDIWIADDQATLMAVGPPSLNLGKSLYPVSVACNGYPISITKTEYRRCSVWTAALPQPIHNCGSYDVTLRFCSFECTVSLSAAQISARSASLSLVTLQKNNPSPWIRDWCLWHRRICGVDRIYVYDNESDNPRELLDTLNVVSEDVDVVLVPWPFPYGILPGPLRSAGQVGARNHCRLRFGQSSGWVISTDIDEYIVVPNRHELNRLSQFYETNGVAVALLASHIVPPIERQLCLEDRSIRDYDFHERFLRRGGWVQKYMYWPQAVELCLIHFAFPKNKLLNPRTLGTQLYERVNGTIQRRLSKYMSPETKSQFFRVARCPVNHAYFLHFRGLNTNWKKEGLGDSVVEFDPSKHVPMREVMELIRRAKIG